MAEWVKNSLLCKSEDLSSNLPECCKSWTDRTVVCVPMGRWEVKTGDVPVPASLVYTVVIYKRERNVDGNRSQTRKETSQRGQRCMLFTQIKKNNNNASARKWKECLFIQHTLPDCSHTLSLFNPPNNHLKHNQCFHFISKTETQVINEERCVLGKIHHCYSQRQLGGFSTRMQTISYKASGL